MERRFGPPDSKFIAKSLEVLADGSFQLGRFLKLTCEFRDKARHFFLERFAVVRDIRRADIAAGGEDETVLLDLLRGGGFAESGFVRVAGRGDALPLIVEYLNHGVTPPDVIRFGDPPDILTGEFAVHPADHTAHLPGVDEEGFATAIPAFAIVLVARKEPEADRDLSGVKQLAGQGDHAVHEIGLNDRLADGSLAGLVRTHAAIGEDEAGHTLRGEVVNEMLDPGEVGVALGRDAKAPANVIVLAAPVAVVERRVGQHIIGAEVRVLDGAKSVGVFLAKVRLDATQGEVHDSQSAGSRVALLTVDADIPDLAAVGFDEFFRLDEHAAGAASGIVDTALVGGEHFHQQTNNTGRRVELPAVLTLGAGELGEEILEDPAQDVLRLARLLLQLNGTDEVDQLAETVFVEIGASVVLVERALEPRVVALDGVHGIVHILADGRQLGAALEVRPAGLLRDPENVLRPVLVRILRIGASVIAHSGEESGVVSLESVGDVFEEDQAEDDVLVFRRVHVVAELVGGEPELRLETEVGGAVFFGRGFFAGRHC